MNLLERFLAITDELVPVFKQRRTARRATSLLVANLLCMGRRWVARLICTRGRDQQDWSADYKLSRASRKYYRQPGYLFCSDHELSAQNLLQIYLDRWQIEVNHRDEKQLIGVADPQVWNGNSVDRIPAFLTASYSFLLLASLEAYGPKRTDDHIQPPKWQRSRRRPSCLDLLNLIRRQATERPDLYGKTDFRLDPTQAHTKMAA